MKAGPPAQGLILSGASTTHQACLHGQLSKSMQAPSPVPKQHCTPGFNCDEAYKAVVNAGSLHAHKPIRGLGHRPGTCACDSYQALTSLCGRHHQQQLAQSCFGCYGDKSDGGASHVAVRSSAAAATPLHPRPGKEVCAGQHQHHHSWTGGSGLTH